MRRKIKKVQSTIGYRADGQAIKKAFYGRTKEAAKAVAEAYRQEHGMPQKALDIYTFAGWAKQWLLLYKKPFVSRAAYTTTYESADDSGVTFGNGNFYNFTDGYNEAGGNYAVPIEIYGIK